MIGATSTPFSTRFLNSPSMLVSEIPTPRIVTPFMSESRMVEPSNSTSLNVDLERSVFSYVEPVRSWNPSIMAPG